MASENVGKYIQITTGQERNLIVGKVVEETNYEVILKHPMQIVLKPTSEGYNIIIQDYMPFALGKLVTIMKSAIVGCSVPDPRLCAYYEQYKAASIKEGMDEHLLSRIIGRSDSATEAILDFDDSPALETDVKH